MRTSTRFGSSVLLGALLVLGTGMSMPGCGNNDALKQQVDAMTKTNQELSDRLSVLENRVTTLSGQLSDLRTSFETYREKKQAPKTPAVHSKKAQPSADASKPAVKKTAKKKKHR